MLHFNFQMLRLDTLNNFLFFFGSHFPAEADPIEANTEETWLVGVLFYSPGHAGDHPHVTLPLVPGQPGYLSTRDIIDVDMSVVLSHRHQSIAVDTNFVHLQNKCVIK